MKSCAIVLCAIALATVAHAGSPVDKVVKLLTGLAMKIQAEEDLANKQFEEFSAWCEEQSRNLEHNIKTGKAEVEDLSAAIEKETAKSNALRTEIEELAGSLAKDEADLQAATGIRDKEGADFAAEEKETSEVLGSLERAIDILKREQAKGGASLLQDKGIQNIAKTLGVMVHASLISSADGKVLTSLVQNVQGSDSDDEVLGAPDPEAYKYDRSNIVGVLEDLLDKAETQLEKLRKTETANSHNYALLKQSLEGEMDADQKDMNAAKKNLGASQEAKATAEGDLAVTSGDLKEDQATFARLAQDCKQGKLDHEEDTESRATEMKAITMAKKILVDENDRYTNAVTHTYGAALDQATDFLQTSSSDQNSRSDLFTGLSLRSAADLANFEAVRFIRDLAKKEGSAALAQLASKMNTVIRFSAQAGQDPMAKVKELITDMIATLEKDAAQEATQQAFCDKETSESKAKQEETSAELDKLTTSIDSMRANSAKLKEEIATLQMELGQLAKSKAEMDALRREEKAFFKQALQEMNAGILGLQQAVSMLRDYYANDSSRRATEGKGGHAAGVAGHNEAGGTIIAELEQVEADFTKTLAEMQVAESTAEREYDENSQMNAMSRGTKESDVKYKTKESAGLQKSLAEATSDKDGVQSELDAVNEYLAKLAQQCGGKVSTFADRKARRTAEIEGLKEALSILEGDAALVQLPLKRAFRGKHTAVQQGKL